MGLKPDFRILIDGKDIPEYLKQRVKSIRIDDHQSEKSDSVTVEFDDRDEDIEEPEKGRNLEIYLGYVGELYLIGRYKISQSYSDGPPGKVTVKATGFDAGSDIKVRKSRNFDEKTAGAILEKIARENGLEPKVSKDFHSSYVPQGMAQCKESDLHYGSRLTDFFGGVFKINDGKLVATKKGTGRTVSGKELKTVTLAREQVRKYSTKNDKIKEYKSAVAYVRNIETGRREEVGVGIGEPRLVLPETFASKDLALAAARSRIGKASMQTESILLELPGDGRLTVERKVKLSGFKKKQVNGQWIVSETSHEYSADKGYSTSLTLQKTLDRGKEDGEAANESEAAPGG